MPRIGNHTPTAAETLAGGDVLTRAQARAAFTNAAGEAVDPEVVTLTIKRPDGSGGFTTTTYTYGEDAELKKEETGRYYLDLALEYAGGVRYYLFGSTTGQAQVAQEGRLHVRTSGVLA